MHKYRKNPGLIFIQKIMPGLKCALQLKWKPKFYLDIVGSAGNALGHCFNGSGSSERFLDDERSTAADTVLGDHPEVVRRVLLEPPDLEWRHRRRADLLPRLLADLATLDNVRRDRWPAVAFRNVPPELHRVVRLPLDGRGAGRRRWLVLNSKESVLNKLGTA